MRALVLAILLLVANKAYASPCTDAAVNVGDTAAITLEAPSSRPFLVRIQGGYELTITEEYALDYLRNRALIGPTIAQAIYLIFNEVQKEVPETYPIHDSSLHDELASYENPMLRYGIVAKHELVQLWVAGLMDGAVTVKNMETHERLRKIRAESYTAIGAEDGNYDVHGLRFMDGKHAVYDHCYLDPAET